MRNARQSKVPKLTPLGRELRKLRIDQSETLGDLAEALKLSVAFLSAIETGRKNVPSDFISRVVEHYKLDRTQYRKLSKLAELSQREVKFSLAKRSDKEREMVALFARNFANLTDVERQKINQVLEKYKEE